MLLRRIFSPRLGLAVALSASAATAATYQIGPARPLTTVQNVADQLLPGDVVEVDGGAVYPGDLVLSRPGTAEAPITIRGIRAGGQRPVISGGTNTITFASPWPYTSGADHYVLDGFEITAGSFRCVFHQADDLTLRDLVVHDCPAHGILGADEGSGSLTLEHSEVYNSGSGDNRHQIYMATDEVNHPGSVFRMRQCYVHDGLGGNNVKSRAERNEIFYNWIAGAFYHELELIGPDGGDGGNPELAREDSDVVGNVLVKRNDFYVIRAGGDGTGQTNGRYRFVNNTIVAGQSAVFRLFDGLESVQMHNNVFVRPAGQPLTVARSVEAVWATGAEVIAGQRNWVPVGALAVPSQWTDTRAAADAGLVDLDAGDLRPAAGSPLLNAASAAPEDPPGYAFPNPLFPPAAHPPVHAAVPAGQEQARPLDGTIDIGAFEREASPLCVDDDNTVGVADGSPRSPFPTIQQAIDAAPAAATIRVAAGVYAENVQISDKSIALLGGYAGGTQQGYQSGESGDFDTRDPRVYVSSIQAASAAVVAVELINTGASGSTVDGLTISGGLRGVEIDTEVSWPHLSGVTISNNVIENNGAAGNGDLRGAGIFADAIDATLDGNVVRNNRGGRGAGIAGGGETMLTITRNTVEDNVSYADHGGGVYLWGNVTTAANVIRGNRVGEDVGYGWGGGILVLGTAAMSGDVVTGNQSPGAGGGVFVDEGATATLAHLLVYGNSTTEPSRGGAGIYVDGGAEGGSTAHIRSCTVAMNAGAEGGVGNGVYVEGGSSVDVQDSILWNGGDDIFVTADSSTLTAQYTLASEPLAGTGNLSVDPFFADAAGGDFHLRSTGGRWDPELAEFVVDSEHSPGIDAADPATPYGAEPSPNGGRANLGAYGNTAEASKSASGAQVSTGSATLIAAAMAVAGGAARGSRRALPGARNRRGK